MESKTAQVDEIKAALSATRVLTLSFLVATLLYILAGYFVTGAGEGGTAASWIMQALIAVTLVIGAVTLIIWPLIDQNRLQQRIASEGDVAPDEVVDAFRRSYLLRLALVEALAVIGLVAGFVFASFEYTLLPGVCSFLLLIVLYLRRRSELERLLASLR